MDKKLFVANWKSHKTVSQTHDFMWLFAQELTKKPFNNAEIVICPSYTSLQACAEFVRVNTLPINVGVQNVSAFEEGAYTGEINAAQVKEYASHVIIGHSERKRHMKESAEDILSKVDQAKKSELTVILCVQDENDTAVQNADVIAYEPPSAIGTGTPDSPEHISEVFKILHEKYPGAKLLYGGSVNKDTIKDFLSIEHLKGFLIGGASLDPQEFYHLISVC